jgi:RNA polymerase sigma factor (sigma-70 family)
VSAPDSTRWTVIRAAAAGSDPDRAEFARQYTSVIRSYLGARWRGGTLYDEIDDATQEVFVQCFRPDGALDGVDPGRRGGFRAYLFGVVRNVARSFERRWRARRARGAGLTPDLDALEARDAPLGDVFDRAWATAILRQAGERQAQTARGDPAAERRVELLRLRFGEDLPIREIARLWQTDADRLHGAYRTARSEFLAALTHVVGDLHGGSAAEIEAECVRLLDHLP